MNRITTPISASDAGSSNAQLLESARRGTILYYRSAAFPENFDGDVSGRVGEDLRRLEDLGIATASVLIIVAHGESGYGPSEQRPMWSLLLERVRAGRAGLVVTRDHTCLTRDPQEGWMLAELFADKEVFVLLDTGLSEPESSLQVAKALGLDFHSLAEGTK